jgi:hypothetical protein
LVYDLDQGWQGYVQPRFADCVDEKGVINVQPHQLDGLSFPMTLVRLIKLLKMETKERVTIVVMGGSGKAEERIFCETNYFEELSHFFPTVSFRFMFAGPELTSERHKKAHKVNDNIRGVFFKQTVGEWIIDNFKSFDNAKDKLGSVDSTLFIGFNPGFGCGISQLI